MYNVLLRELQRIETALVKETEEPRFLARAFQLTTLSEIAFGAFKGGYLPEDKYNAFEGECLRVRKRIPEIRLLSKIFAPISDLLPPEA